MTKPLSRVAVAMLIVLIIILGVFFTAQAASASSGAVKGRVDATASDSYFSSQQRGGGAPLLSPYGMDGYHEGGHGGCESEGLNSSDY